MRKLFASILLSVSMTSIACMPPPHVEGMQVNLSNARSKEPVREQKVMLKIVIYKHCAEPCNHDSEIWEGATDSDGNLQIPWRIARAKPELYVEGY